MQFEPDARSADQDWRAVFADGVIEVIFEGNISLVRKEEWASPRLPIAVMSAPRLRVVHIRYHPEILLLWPVPDLFKRF